MEKSKKVVKRVKKVNEKDIAKYEIMAIESYKYDIRDMGVCDFTGYCTSSCQYYGSGCEII